LRGTELATINERNGNMRSTYGFTGADVLATKLKPTDLVGLREVAKMIGRSYPVAYSRATTDVTFPAPALIIHMGTRVVRQYRRADIERWGIAHALIRVPEASQTLPTAPKVLSSTDRLTAVAELLGVGTAKLEAAMALLS
jgi:predicted DNA-binding transcriptional regulator AlpA